MHRLKTHASAVLLLLLLSSLFMHVVSAREITTTIGEMHSEDEEGIPLGLRITETLHQIIREHKEAIAATILDFRLELGGLIENRTELVEEFLEERINRTREIRESIRELRELYLAGNITAEKYLAELSIFRAELKALHRSYERLKEFIHESLLEAVKEKVERLREINRELGKQVSEEARRIREELRSESTVEETSSTTATSETQIRERRRDRDHVSSATMTTATSVEEFERGRAGGHENRGHGNDGREENRPSINPSRGEGRGRQSEDDEGRGQ
ncbi:MAG: hypothetical protein QXJ29_06520 [Nitrososphaerota archaeon]